MSMTTEVIWQSLHRELRGYIVRQTKDPYAADDILQEVFLRIHRSVRALKEETKLRAWVYRIARNAITDHYRARRIMTELPEELPDPSDAGEEEREWSEELSACVMGMVKGLPAMYSEALLLYEFQGMSHKDIADRLGLSLSGAKSRVQRGRALLKEALLLCCEFERDRRGSILHYTPRDPACRNPAEAGCCG